MMSPIRCLIAFCCVTALAIQPVRGEPILIRFSHVVSESAPKGVGANLFKRKVEERLAGRVRVQVFPRSVRYNDSQALLGLLFGDVEMAAPSFAKFRNYTKKLQIFDLPFLFKDVDAVHRFQSSESGRNLLSSLEIRGIKGLDFWDNGMRVVSANKPLRSPQDLRGLTFRIEPSLVFQEQFLRLGARPVPMPFKQLHDAVKLGVVDGQENAWSNIYSQKLHELHRYFTELNHTFLGYMVVTSVAFWASLPPDIRAELETILQETTTVVNRLAREQAMTARQKAVETPHVRVLEPTEAELEEWRKALLPLTEQFTPAIGRDLLDAAATASQVR